MASTRPSIMSLGAMTSAPRARATGPLHEHLHGLIVEDLTVDDDAVVTVRRVRVQRHVWTTTSSGCAALSAAIVRCTRPSDRSTPRRARS